MQEQEKIDERFEREREKTKLKSCKLTLCHLKCKSGGKVKIFPKVNKIKSKHKLFDVVT